MGESTEMACRELVEVITEYLEGTLDPVERRRFEQHLAGCAGCRDYLEQMRTTIRLTGMLRVDALLPSTRQDLIETFRGWRRGRDQPLADGG
jgi:predicted anti-sigma-YlaC factor YlaD